jgi:hypothetical protein
MRELDKASDEIVEIGPNRVLGKFFGVLEIPVSSIINLRSVKKYFK